jgi:hypothetical protein
MADMLVELIQKFIDGSDATLNSLFKSMVNLVFFIERELNNIQVDGGTKIDFNGMYQVVFSYACFILVIVFIAKLIKIYFLQTDGDAEKNPIHLIVGMIKAVIVMICCKEIYDLFVGIVSNFLNSILGAMPVKTVSLAEALSGNISGGIFTAVACLVLLITWLILICQFIMKGIEMLLMRMGIPFATIRIVKFRWRCIP